ncbi:iron chelate uptake ABC transporter family permease subunit [Salinibacterium sp. SWN248]|uniref:FecCD family ABC transporter permease n=1 Tax=Salinibacterium sp. SWN248 TaxID=2792056 RepID=UPI0018CD8487|nr:iron chelate uptake ABC transporter family permease subunit [Salinibacterium sp. SWN248]MBH0023094.1 iron chelate uptake ABC transporter family permease subunit [Salinibacterium sp. SWN248]
MRGAPVSASRASRVPLTARALRITIGLIVAAVALALVSIAVGAYTLTLPDLLATLFGGGTSSDQFIVFKLRLPRVLLAILVAIAFGLAGALFQSLLRNALASPDIIGISGGASVAAVLSLLVFGATGLIVSLSALVGALLVAFTIYLLSWRSGMNGMRFVLIGVGIAFMAQSVLGYLITRGDVRDAQQALVWMVGGLGGASWDDILIMAVSLAILVPAVAVLASKLRMLQLGDDLAAGLGVSVQRSRVALIVVAVALVAIATALVGPLAFVAFVSAPIARRLVRRGDLALVPSALVAIVLVLGADFVAQHLLTAGTQVPTGIVTGIVGAPYLLWLISTTNREGRAS